MGSLNLPSAGRVYIDTQSVIYTIEHNKRYEPTLLSLWAAVSAGTIELVTSELTVMEALVGPYKSRDRRVEAAFEHLFGSAVLTLLPVTLDVLRSAARLRATVPKLRTPDAIHAATALLAGISLFVTNDFAFRAVPGLVVEVLDEVIARP